MHVVDDRVDVARDAHDEQHDHERRCRSPAEHDRIDRDRERREHHRGEEMEVATVLGKGDGARAPYAVMTSNTNAPTSSANGSAARRRKPVPRRGRHASASPTTSSAATATERAGSCRSPQRLDGDPHHESRGVANARVVAGVTGVADDREPREVHRGERHRVRERRPPASQDQHRDADGDDHRDPDARAHQRRGARGEAEVVAPVDRALVAREQEVHEPERERSDQGHLERQDDVLVAVAEEHEDQRDDRRRPRAHADAAHDRADQERGTEMREHDDDLVGPVRPDPERPPQRGYTSTGIVTQCSLWGRKRSPRLPAVAPREEVPLVEEEPRRPRDRHVEDERNHLADHEEAERRTGGCRVVPHLSRHSRPIVTGRFRRLPTVSA